MLKSTVVWILIAVLAVTSLASLTANAATRVTARENCQAIESIKTRVRASAIRSLEELPVNAGLLGLVLTTKAVARAISNRDRTLSEYAPRSCSLVPWRAHDPLPYEIPPPPLWTKVYFE